MVKKQTMSTTSTSPGRHRERRATKFPYWEVQYLFIDCANGWREGGRPLSLGGGRVGEDTQNGRALYSRGRSRPSEAQSNDNRNVRSLIGGRIGKKNERDAEDHVGRRFSRK